MAQDATRYDYKPFIGSSHTIALKEILKNKKDISILDIGSAKGMMGKLLRENNFQNIDAVEIDENAREKAKEIYNNMYSSIFETTRKYDLVLLLDVIEHTAIPEEFLNQIIEKINDDGKLVISVPNIAHWYIRLNLLCGNFDYQEKGILDRTHLHFFTKKTIFNLIKSFSNLSIETYKVSSTPYELFLSNKIIENPIFKFFAKIKLSFVNLFPKLLGYQHILVIKKNKGN